MNGQSSWMYNPFNQSTPQPSNQSTPQPNLSTPEIKQQFNVYISDHPAFEITFRFGQPVVEIKAARTPYTFGQPMPPEKPVGEINFNFGRPDAQLDNQPIFRSVLQPVFRSVSQPVFSQSIPHPDRYTERVNEEVKVYGLELEPYQECVDYNVVRWKHIFCGNKETSTYKNILKRARRINCHHCIIIKRSLGLN